MSDEGRRPIWMSDEAATRFVTREDMRTVAEDWRKIGDDMRRAIEIETRPSLDKEEGHISRRDPEVLEIKNWCAVAQIIQTIAALIILGATVGLLVWWRA
jgi:hypothetical protein